MESIKLKAAFLYPDIFCLNGDRANITALSNTAIKLGVDMQIDRINLPDEMIDFASYDIVYIPSGELKYILMVAQALRRQKDRLQKAIESGTIFLLTGTSVALFAEKITRDDGSVYEGLGLAGYECRERATVYGDDLIFSATVFGEEMNITGCQIGMIDTFLNEGTAPLGKVLYGYGNHGKGDEGILFNNCLLTNALGPVLIKNPWLTVAMIKQVIHNNNMDVALPALSWPIEESSAKKIWEFIENKEKPKR